MVEKLRLELLKFTLVDLPKFRRGGTKPVSISKRYSVYLGSGMKECLFF